ncbi:hypothetical protein KY332_00620 [Candidatus Woesearchaeota archaeon]|nr:hypothetical protein [Candidatus Woesearchaeota archaeon]
MAKKDIIQFYIGLALALSSAVCIFFGVYHPGYTAVSIAGIALIATSKYRLLK